jgi:hypothetical protein
MEIASDAIGERNRFTAGFPFPPTGPPTRRARWYRRIARSSTIIWIMDEPPPYEVACVELDARLEATSHPHVTFIETRDPDGGRRRWSREQALAAMRRGERFVVATDGNGTPAPMEAGLCPRCPFFTLLVDPPEALPIPC